MSRLLVLRLSALGDVIHTLPAVALLRDSLPETRIQWVVEAPYRELVELVGRVEAIPVRLKRWSRAPLASHRDMRLAMRAMRGVDISVDFQGLIKSAALGAVARATERYGFDAEAIREKAALLFINRRVKVDTEAHVVEQNLELARAVGATGEPALDWSVFPQGTVNPKTIVLLPGAGKPNKLWPVDRFRELASRLGEHALVVWGPGERDLAEAIGGRMAPPTNLRELAAVLQGASLVVGADTGPLHLAAALGTKVVGLYGPTNPRRNGPYGQLHRCIDRFSTAKTMESITVDDVVTRIDEVLSE